MIKTTITRTNNGQQEVVSQTEKHFFDDRQRIKLDMNMNYMGSIKDISERPLKDKHCKKTARRAMTVTNAVNGMKYVGKIKLIQSDSSDSSTSEVETKSNTSVDLSEELNYREKVSVADRLNVFRQKDKEQQELDKQRREEEAKKRSERQRKEEERLKKEEERKMKIRQQLEEKERERRQLEQEKEENGLLENETSGDANAIDYDQREVAMRRQRVSEGHFDENEDETRSVKVDLNDELKYRDVVRVSDRLSAFKEAEREEQARKKQEREEESRKRAERQRKEEERLRKEEERKMKIRQQLEEKERERRESEKDQSDKDEMRDEADQMSRQDSEINYDMAEVAAMRRKVAEGNFETESSSAKVDLSEELKYRGEVRVSDRLAAFKDAEKEERDRLQREKEEEARKRKERQMKEEERMRREEQRKEKILKDIEEKERIRRQQEEERRQREAEQEVVSNDTFIDLKSELQYRNEMETKVSDRVASFKRAEKESIEQSKNQKEEDERKMEERRRKEEERMHREEERKREIQSRIEKQREISGVNASISIEREREIMDQVDEEFRIQKYTQDGEKSVLKRWTSSPDSPPQRRSSDDSGIVNEDSMEAQVLSDDQCAPCDERMKEFEKQLSTNSEKDVNTKRASSEDMLKLIEDEKNGLLVRLNLAETRAAEAKAYYENLINEGADSEAVEYEEEFHEASLEISRIKKRLLQLEDPANEILRRQTSVEKPKSSRECKAPISRPRPPVDIMSFNDDGECVPEGIITNRLQTFNGDLETS